MLKILQISHDRKIYLYIGIIDIILNFRKFQKKKENNLYLLHIRLDKD